MSKVRNAAVAGATFVVAVSIGVVFSSEADGSDLPRPRPTMTRPAVPLLDWPFPNPDRPTGPPRPRPSMIRPTVPKLPPPFPRPSVPTVTVVPETPKGC